MAPINKTAGKYAACRENAEAKLAAGSAPSKYTEALDKCETKFSAAWQKLEDKALAAGVLCPGVGGGGKGNGDHVRAVRAGPSLILRSFVP